MQSLPISPIFRLSAGLAFMATILLTLGYLVGLVPDVKKEKRLARLTLCETIGACTSAHAERGDSHLIDQMLSDIADQNDDIVSIAVKERFDLQVAQQANHQARWNAVLAETGSPSLAIVPVFVGDQVPWGTIEIRFRDLPQPGLLGRAGSTWFFLLGLFPLAVFVGTVLYLRSTLSQMDWSDAMPSRVRSALDNLTSALLILDNQGHIVLANQAFALASGYDSDALQGKLVSSLPWYATDTEGEIHQYNWLESISNGKRQPAALLSLDTEVRRTFLVNCTPVEDEQEPGKYRGVLASFEDVTRLKEKELELQQMLDELAQSREEIRQHNAKLRELATKDPLTGCLNRRAFFERAGQEWKRASRYKHPLSCVMLDLDFFKAINDTYGHTTGDTVLKRVGRILGTTLRDADIVCRYGGEEFCVLLPHIDHDGAVQAAKRFQREIFANVTVDQKPVTASIGVSSASLGGEHLQGMIEQADRALYLAKHLGRNRVACFEEVDEDFDFGDTDVRPPVPQASEADVAIPFHAVTALVSALGYRDSATADHSRRVADLCVAVAGQVMSTSECYIVEIAALLHDIGKIGVPDAILLKPGPLTNEEWEVMGVHDQMGIEIVDSAFNSPMLTEIIESHHAFFGGNGRHDHLPSGEDIPLGARLLSIADTYDAIVSDRVYRKGRSRESAFAELRRCAGTQFDPELVEVFIETIETREPSSTLLSRELNKRTALRIGVQIERLSQAIDREDNDSFRALLGRLRMTAQAGKIHEIAELVDSIDQAVNEESDLAEIVGMTNELLGLCRSTQRVFLDSRFGTDATVESKEQESSL